MCYHSRWIKITNEPSFLKVLQFVPVTPQQNTKLENLTESQSENALACAYRHMYAQTERQVKHIMLKHYLSSCALLGHIACTECKNAASRYRFSIICVSVCWKQPQPCKNRWTDRDAIWVVDLGVPKEPHIRLRPNFHRGGDNFGGMSCPIEKYREKIWWSADKRLTRSTCGLGRRRRLAKRTMGTKWGLDPPRQGQIHCKLKSSENGNTNYTIHIHTESGWPQQYTGISYMKSNFKQQISLITTCKQWRWRHRGMVHAAC